MKAKWIAFFVALTICLSMFAQPQAVNSAAPKTCTPGPHSGEITSDQTWCAADNPHILTSSVVVDVGVTLTIEPGVTVMGSSGAELKTLGHLSAVGNEEHPIIFTSSADSGPVQWAGLSFVGGTGDLQYVTVRYGGGDGNSIGRGDIAINNVLTGEVHIENSTISEVSYSFYLHIVECLWVINSHVTVNNTTFSGCATSGGYYDRNYPVYISGAASVATLTGNTIVNNYKNRIALEPGAMMGQDATLWPQAEGGTYELISIDTNNFTVPAGITLTVMPGVTVLGNSERELQVQGDLNAQGTADHPILFSSVSDSAPEQWPGIVFEGGSGHLTYTTVRYAGQSNSAGWRAGVTVDNVQAGDVVLENATVSNNWAGFYLTISHGMVINNSHVQITDSLFSNNGKPAGGAYRRDYALYIAGADSAVSLTGNTFTGNSRNKIGLAPGTFSSSAVTTLTRQAVFDGYELDGSYTVFAPNALVLEPGVTLSGRTAQDELLVLGHLEAVGTAEQPITFTSGDNNAWGQWPGVIFNGGTGHLSFVTARYGGVQSSLSTYGTINAINVPANSLLIDNSQITDSLYYGLQISNSSVKVINTRFMDNGENPRDNDVAIYADQNSAQLIITSCLFDGNARDLIMNSGNVILTNNVFLGGWTNAYGGYNHAVKINNGASAILLHNTIANLHGSGVYVASGGSANLTNSIFAQNTYGITVEVGGTGSLGHTLWDRNGTNIVGDVSETGSLSGIAGFAPDGYHLTRYSMAVEQGMDAGVTFDIDGQDRPLPAGTAPDLGADEFPFTFGQDFAAEMFSFDPQWVVLPDPVTRDPSGKLRQGYYTRYFYGSPESNPPGLSVDVAETLPVELVYESQQTNPLMDFSVQGQTLTWESQKPLQKNKSGEIIVTGLYDQPIPGTLLTNTGTLTAGDLNFNLQSSSKVPLFSPLITFPGDGEICTGPGNVVNLTVKGAAQNSSIVKLYEDSSYVSETTAGTDGLFTFTYISTRVGVDTFTLSARTCLPSDPTQCSDPYEVHLTPQQSYWDPQLSYWEFFPSTGPSVVEHFRNNGLYSTQEAIRPKSSGFPHSTLHMYVCQYTYDVWATVNNEDYYPEVEEHNRPAAKYGYLGETIINIKNAEDNPCSLLNIRLQENGIIHSDHSCALTDPDGYVFDVTKGFDPANPTQHTLAGAMVTCMVYQPSWGGWIPWPAQLYDNQVNPQVTASDGHFAFFTPPGFYYLQVDGAEGYQSWRSPVIQVVDEVVRVNVPLTPISTAEPFHITLTASGPVPAEVTIPAGSTVEWLSELSGVLPPEEIMELILDPVVHNLSDLDPLANIQGWDSGMLIPGQVYTRQFISSGTYTYTDGYGNIGTIIVEQYRFFLPAIQR